TLKLASLTRTLGPPTFTAVPKICDAASITSKRECNTCNHLSKRSNLEPKSFAHPPQRFNVASQTLTRACWRYLSPPLKYPLESLGLKIPAKMSDFSAPRFNLAFWIENDHLKYSTPHHEHSTLSV